MVAARKTDHDSDEIRRIVKGRLRRKPVVVVSALGGVTDRLEKLGIDAALHKPWKREVGEIVSLHEAVAVKLGVLHGISVL